MVRMLDTEAWSDFTVSQRETFRLNSATPSCVFSFLLSFGCCQGCQPIAARAAQELYLHFQNANLSIQRGLGL